MKKFISTFVALSMIITFFTCTNCQPCFAICQAKKSKINKNETLTSNVWRSTFGTKSGNTIQWDYQVSAVYSGDRNVKKIRTTFKGSASLRSSASMNLGISASGASAGEGSSWQSVSTSEKYWENSNGAKSSSYRSNIVISPACDYRDGTISVTNTARVELNDGGVYEITSGV